MTFQIHRSLLPLALFLVSLTPSCSGDRGGGSKDEMAVCDEAWDTWCACESVSCDGRPASCTGPDKEWAECINAAEDACTAACD